MPAGLCLVQPNELLPPGLGSRLSSPAHRALLSQALQWGSPSKVDFEPLVSQAGNNFDY